MIRVTERVSALLRCSLATMIVGPLMVVSVAGGSRPVIAVAAQLTPTPTATPDTCRDSFEDDGVPTQAGQIVLGETQAHIFCPAGDADWVTFFAKGGKAYSIETSELSIGVDTYLNLFAPDGRTLLATNDDAGGSRGVSRLLFYPQLDGWYFVQAKNQGDVGRAGFQYSLSLKQVDVPTGTPFPTQVPTLQATATTAPTTAPAQPTMTPFSADLLHPQKGDGAVDVFEAGPEDALQPDGLEPNDSRETARPINVGAVYKRLNFVSSVSGTGAADTDFFTFRAKPGLCYLVQTGDLSSGIDTTILLWQAVPVKSARDAKERWKLAVQNDDAHPRTPDLGSAVRWCAGADIQSVLEISNYGGPVATDPRGKSYSLSLAIDPPTPTPTRVPPAPVPAQAAGAAPQRPSGSSGGAVQVQQVPLAPVVQQPQATGVEVARATATPSFTPTALPSFTPVAPSPTAVPLPPSATPAPQVSVDVVAYVGDQSSTGPNPGDGIVDLPVLLVDVRTNAVIQRALTDHNGHAQLNWQWQGPVRVAMPAFRWGRTLQPGDFAAGTSGSMTGAAARPGGQLLLLARMSTYSLPGIYP